MAQLKDTIVTGDLSVTGTIYGNVPLDDLSGYTGTTGFLKKENDSWSLSAVTIPDATSVKGDAETTYRTGQVNLTPANLGISATTTSVTVGSTTFNKYTHPTGAGNNHIPSGGSSGQFLGWSSAGTAAWVANPNTDTKVTQAAAITTTGNYPILLAYDTNTTEVTNSVNKTSTLKYNPSTKKLVVDGDIEFGDGTTATLWAKTPSRNAGVLMVGGGKETEGNADGTVVRLQSGGLMMIGSGEYTSNRYNNVAGLSDRTEALYLGSDGATYIETNSNTIANRQTFTFATDGSLTAPGGFVGNLTGVASKATAANITTTTNAIAIYSNTTGTFSTKATASGAAYATAANGALTFGTLPMAQGGTGATTAAAARTNLLAAAGNGRIFYGTCDTAAATTAKVVTCASYDALTVGDIVIVKFTNTNEGAVGSLTLNVNGKGAKSIKKLYNYSIANLTNAGELYAGTVGMFIYDGTYWILSNADYSSANTQLRVYRQNSGYNSDYPLLVSRTAAGSIGTAGTNSSNSAVYGVMWDDTTKIPTLNPSTGLLKVPGGITANLTGNADTATKLGTANVGGITSPIYLAEGVPTVVQQSNADHRYSVVPAVDSAGVMEVGKYIDFHDGGNDSNDYTIRLTAADNKLVTTSGNTPDKTLRNISYGTEEPSGGADGDIYIQYNGGDILSSIIDIVYPVGSIYMNVQNINPATLFGGTWERIAQGKCLFGWSTSSPYSTPGASINAGLPNVTGKVVYAYSDYNVGNSSYSNFVSGPFYYDNEVGTNANLGSGSSDAHRQIHMDLSRANSIYGNSTTVQPPAIVVCMWQRIS